MKKIAARTLSIEMHLDSKNRLHAAGRLVDDRNIPFLPYGGEVTPPGRFHDISAELIVNLEDFVIEEIKVAFPKTPEISCAEISTAYDKLKGSSISSGFTKKVREIAGGEKGCAHLTHLIISMGPAIVQGGYTALAQAPMEGLEQSRHTEQNMADFFKGACHVWRE